MFKLFVKLMLFLLVLALAAPFILKGPDGRPLLSLSDLELPRFELPQVNLPGSDSDNSQPANDERQWIRWSKQEGLPFNPDKLTPAQLAQLDIRAQDNIYYRWQDGNGVWQYSTLPNRNTTNFVVRTDPGANVLQSLPSAQIDRVFGRDAPADNAITKDNPMANGKGLESGLLPVPTTVPVTEIPKLLEQAKNVQKLADQRLKQMEAAGSQ